MKNHRKTLAAEAINFIRSEDGDLESLMLAACLTALGVPFFEKPSFAVTGDARPSVNWLFDEQSTDGKYRASDIIAKWNDRAWITAEDNEHPAAYIAAAMRNLQTLIAHHMGNAPTVEIVKRGRKALVLPEGTPESQLGILINKLTRP